MGKYYLNKGYITRKDINENGIPSFFLYDYVKKNKLIKYGTGFYARNDWIKDDYFIFQYLYPKYIVYINRQSDGRQIVDSITGVNE